MSLADLISSQTVCDVLNKMKATKDKSEKTEGNLFYYRSSSHSACNNRATAIRISKLSINCLIHVCMAYIFL